MPMPILLAHRVARRLAEVRRDGTLPFLRPDGKSQVTVEYDADGRPTRVHTVLVSTQHDPEVETGRPGRGHSRRTSSKPRSPPSSSTAVTRHLVNPTGRFVIGGPKGDSGLSGRKIIVDTYGGMARHGGGSFSGKDPTKVDRSGAYMARYVAKNVVAAGLARRCELQLAYAIGVAHPLAVNVQTWGTGVAARRATSPSSSAEPSTCDPARSSARSTFVARSTARPRPTATSAARISTCRGSGSTASTSCARPPAERVVSSGRPHSGGHPAMGRATAVATPSPDRSRADGARRRVRRAARRGCPSCRSRCDAASWPMPISPPEREGDHRRAAAGAVAAMERAVAVEDWWPADVWAHRALWHFERADLTLQAARQARRIGDLRSAAGDPGSARRYYAEAIDEARDIGAEHEQGLAALGMGRAMIELGEVSAGRRLAGAAVDLLDRARAPAGEIEAARALQGTEVPVGGRSEEDG